MLIMEIKDHKRVFARAVTLQEAQQHTVMQQTSGNNCPKRYSGSHKAQEVGLHDIFEKVRQCKAAPSAKQGTALLKAQPVDLKHWIILLNAAKIQEWGEN